MEHPAKSIRPFIGAKNYNISSFYRDLGFKEGEISANMSVFTSGSQAFTFRTIMQRNG